jgi:dTDP-4-amino-4,6-dideoxygalactose transaminase
MLGKTNGVLIPRESPHNKHVYHIYAIRVQNRDALIKALAEKDIHCGIHYPIPLHLQDAYKALGLRKGSFPVAEKVASEFVSLPMFPELDQDQIEFVARELGSIITGQFVR